MNDITADLMSQLHAPFEPSAIDWKPQAISNNRALAVAFVDARAVMTRLDKVFGLGGWQTSYEVLPNDCVVCTLRVKVQDEWCNHQDVGSPSEQPQNGDRLKAAFSDSLKRAAVHLGIGRYLYNLPTQWCDYDTVKRCFVHTPKLPDWAVPAKRKAQNGASNS